MNCQFQGVQVNPKGCQRLPHCLFLSKKNIFWSRLLRGCQQCTTGAPRKKLLFFETVLKTLTHRCPGSLGFGLAVNLNSCHHSTRKNASKTTLDSASGSAVFMNTKMGEMRFHLVHQKIASRERFKVNSKEKNNNCQKGLGGLVPCPPLPVSSMGKIQIKRNGALGEGPS